MRILIDVDVSIPNLQWYASFHVNVWHQDDTGEWRALPYQVAHGLVRTLVLHFRKLQDTKAALDAALATDPQCRKKKTQDLQVEVINLKNSRRFLVFNKRTGQVASQDWMQRHIHVRDGRPLPKQAGHKPWIASLLFKAHANNKATVRFAISDREPDRPVRCWELDSGEEKQVTLDLIDGYEHMDVPEDAEEEAAAPDDPEAQESRTNSPQNSVSQLT